MDEDARLLVASRSDPEAFRAIYDRWAERLLIYFYARVRDHEVAADLLAETFAVAFERRGHFRDIGRPGAAWLYGIAQRELSHYFRRRSVDTRALRRLGVERPSIDDVSIAQIEALADAELAQPRLHAALGRLRPGDREIVELRVLEELDYPQIAERLGCSVGTARTRVHRGLSRMAALLEACS